MRRTTYRRGSKSRVSRRKIVVSRFGFTASNQTAGTVDIRLPLADFETAYGAQLIGATIMGIRGNITVRNRGNVTASPIGEFSYGFMVTQPEQADLVAGHPNSTFTGVLSNDKYSSWMWIEQFYLPTPIATLVGSAATPDWTSRDFRVRSRRVLRNLEDSLVYSHTAGVATTNNYDIGMACSIFIALP